jgi:indole-3-glycerol phosphate synthase / phosphoribosylanthranilate isomerase
MDFLSEILAIKRKRVEAAKDLIPLDGMRELALQFGGGRDPHSFSDALRSYRGINLIAEFKRRSPSKGQINPDADPAVTAKIYQSAGAAAISVLTEEDYFEGSLEDLREVREATWLPVLRKDFIFDEYQLYESAAARADAVLLIAAVLDDNGLARLRSVAEDELGLDALVEVHTKAELDRALKCGAKLVGVNNRDLHTFAVSIETSRQLAPAVPPGTILVSESGLNPQAARELRAAGYHGFLVGETLMRADDPGAALREFIEEPDDAPPRRSVWVKICGITNVDDARAAIAAGADMLGFNFYRKSPRYIEPSAVARIVAAVRGEIEACGRAVSMVGVFVNERVESVMAIAKEANLGGIQLHGDETVDFCNRVKRLSPERFLIKALAANRGLRLELLKDYPSDAVMIDASHEKLRGGTGQIADWKIAREAVEKSSRVFLAGGLSPENVADAISQVRPYAVDACSSLESSPGRKDHARIKAFVRAVQNA